MRRRKAPVIASSFPHVAHPTTRTGQKGRPDRCLFANGTRRPQIRNSLAKLVFRSAIGTAPRRLQRRHAVRSVQFDAQTVNFAIVLDVRGGEPQHVAIAQFERHLRGDVR